MRARVTLSAIASLAFSTVFFAAPTKHTPLAAPASLIAKSEDHAARASTNRLAPDDESQIRQVLAIQVAAWNRGDVDSFMTGYWRSDKTLFVGANGVTRGWLAVLDRYHRAYPNRSAMGHLTFSNLEIQQDCPGAAVAIGEYHLQRQKDHPSGVFTLNFRRFPEGWRIVVDHTTAFAGSAAAPRHR